MSDSYDPMDCSLPGSSIHGILQQRVLEWVAIAFSNNKLSARQKGETSYYYKLCLLFTVF